MSAICIPALDRSSAGANGIALRRSGRNEPQTVIQSPELTLPAFASRLRVRNDCARAFKLEHEASRAVSRITGHTEAESERAPSATAWTGLRRLLLERR